MVTQFTSGIGTNADVVSTTFPVTSPLDGYLGHNNSAIDVNARWSSARLARFGIRMRDTTAILNKQGLLRIV